MNKLFLLLALIFSSLILSAQIDQWRGPNRDGRFTDTDLLDQWPESGPELLLEVSKIGKGFSSPILVDGIIYTTGMIDTLDYLSAIDLDGNIKWQVAYGRSWNKSFPDTRSTPTIEGNRIYVQSGTGRLACIDRESGKENWAVDVDKDFETEYHLWGNSETPLIVDDKVICSPGGKKTSIVAFDKMTGDLVWQSKSLEGPRAYASATIYEYKDLRFVLAVIGTHLLALDPENGEVAWTYKYFDPEKWDQTGLIWTNTPVFHEYQMFLSKGYNYPAVMLEVDSTGESVSEKFVDQTFDNHHHGIIYHDGYLYGSNWRNNRRGKWICMNWESGEIMYVNDWESKGSIIMAEEMLYCYNEKGTVGLVKPDIDGFEVVSEFKITKGAGPHWAHPYIADKKLLIRHGDVLMVYDIKK